MVNSAQHSTGKEWIHHVHKIPMLKRKDSPGEDLGGCRKEWDFQNVFRHLFYRNKEVRVMKASCRKKTQSKGTEGHRWRVFSTENPVEKNKGIAGGNLGDQKGPNWRAWYGSQREQLGHQVHHVHHEGTMHRWMTSWEARSENTGWGCQSCRDTQGKRWESRE